jgi:PAS domain S-box-containing protein
MASSPELLRQVLSALAGEDPEQASIDALAILEAGGVEPTDAAHAAVQRLGLARIAERDKLRAAQERAEMLSSASFEGIFIHENGVIIDANERVAELLAGTREQVLGSDILRRCVAPEDLASVLARIQRGEEGGYVVNAVRMDGTRFRAEFLAKQGRLGDRPVRVAAVRDVTERERTAALLRESETRLQRLLETAFDFFVMSREFKIVDIAGGFRQILGYEREDVVGQHALHFVAEHAREATVREIGEQREGAYETCLVDARNQDVPVEVVGVTATLNGQRVRVAAFRDLREAKRLAAERRKLEAQVEQAQRLDSLGVLAGGIAHDFNNLLVGVLGHAELLLMRVREPRDRQAAEAIVAAAHRAGNLTAQMLAYAGAKALAAKEPIGLDVLWHELHALLEVSISKKARLELQFEPGCVVLGERTTLTQVLMNLLSNASDALGGEPGTICVSARRVQTPDARFAHALLAEPSAEGWVLLEVSDSGMGMDEATRRRIFEPFFTTKQRGHGLGLAACLGIVASHGGAIVVQSEPGRGSCFALLLPAAASDAPGSERSPAVLAREQGRRVAVIDDEALVREYLRALLEQSGHQVLEAGDGNAGLRLLATERVDVVVLDMTMPELDGVQLVRRLRARGSQVPVILCSGNLDASAAHDLAPGDVQARLQKPFGAAALLDAIERVCAK